ncbi:MAG: peroxiredoxin-like family protein [Phycisphaerales bacterium]
MPSTRLARHATLLCAALFLTAPAPAQEEKPSLPSSPAPQSAPERPAKPGLAVGDKVPDSILLNEQGKEVKLSSLWKEGPVVITFYRGGWCPYCNLALAAWHDKTPELKAAGASLVAISPETPEHLHKTRGKAKSDYVALCDAKGDAARGMKVIFRLDAETQQKYRGFGVDLHKRNQSGEWDLPAPATFIVDREGVVRWVFAEWDYKKRAEPAEVIAAVKALKTSTPTKPAEATPSAAKPESK